MIASNEWPLIDFFSDPTRLNDFERAGIDSALFTIPADANTESGRNLPLVIHFGSEEQVDESQLEEVRDRLAHDLSQFRHSWLQESNDLQKKRGFFPLNDLLFINVTDRSVTHIEQQLPWLTDEVFVLTDFVDVWRNLTENTDIGYIDLFYSAEEVEQGVRGCYSSVFDKEGRYISAKGQVMELVTSFSELVIRAYDENSTLNTEPLALRFDLVNGRYYPVHEWTEVMEWENDDTLAEIMAPIETALSKEEYDNWLLFVFKTTVDAEGKTRLTGETLSSRPLNAESSMAIGHGFIEVSRHNGKRSLAAAFKGKELNGIWSVDMKKKRCYLGFSRDPFERSLPSNSGVLRIHKHVAQNAQS